MYLKLWVWHWVCAFDRGPGFFTSSLSFWHGANLLTCVILVCLTLEKFQWPRHKYRRTIRPRSMGAIEKHQVCDWPLIQANWSHLALSWVESWFSWNTRLVLDKDEWARDLAQAWSFSYSIAGMGSGPWQLLWEGAMNSCGGPPPWPEFILNWKYLY